MNQLLAFSVYLLPRTLLIVFLVFTLPDGCNLIITSLSQAISCISSENLLSSVSSFTQWSFIIFSYNLHLSSAVPLEQQPSLCPLHCPSPDNPPSELTRKCEPLPPLIPWPIGILSSCFTPNFIHSELLLLFLLSSQVSPSH